MSKEDDEKLYQAAPEIPSRVGLKLCANACLQNEVTCDFSDCRHWIDFPDDNNCSQIAIDKYRQYAVERCS